MGTQQRNEIRDELCAHAVQVDSDSQIGQASPDQLVLAQQALDLRSVDRAKLGQHVALFKFHVCAQPPVEVRPKPGSVFACIRVKSSPQLSEELVEPLVVSDELAAQGGSPRGGSTF